MDPMQGPDCVRCAVRMEEGFLADLAGDPGLGPKFVQQWVAGPPEPGFVVGVKLRNKERRDVAAFRCPKCGRLELIAP